MSLHLFLQIMRRCIQVAVLLLCIMIPVLSLYAHYRAAHVIEDEVLMAGMPGEVVTRFIHPYVDRLDDPQALLDANKGTLWSMRLAGVDLADPLAAAEMTAASKHVHWPLVVSIAIPVVVTLLLGRVFCSWICPGYLLFELTGKIRKLLRIAEIQPGEVRFSHANKYIFLVAGLGLTAVTSAPLFALLYPPAVISRAIHAWVFGTALTGMLVLLGVIVVFEVLVSPRWWCQTMCPGGALYALIGWARPLRVKLKAEACTGCRACIPVCEAGINPITESTSIECDNCGVCIRHCGDGALSFGLAWPQVGKERQEAKGPRQENSLPVASCHLPSHPLSLLVLLLATLAFGRPAIAHHILGLPHYSYKENYPQRPTLEYPATTGPYDVLLTSYPGIPVPGEPSNLAFYIKDREAGVVYAQPISIRVLQTHTFGDSTVIVPPTRREPFDNEHKFYVTFPVDGEYIIELSIMVEGELEVIPFLMVAGDPTAATSVFVAAASLLVVGFIVVRAMQVKQRRRLGQAGSHPRAGVPHGAVAQPVL
ncbi:MAG: 4Fe-4S binding protein [Planctomycetes bacterium]|nr:4Fe-4S binding protein [Planctomycetota bacterium]